MEVAPENVASRFSQMYSSDLKLASSEMIRVMEETLSLVHERYPMIDLTNAQRMLLLERKFFSEK